MAQRPKKSYAPGDSAHDEPEDGQVVKNKTDRHYRKTIPAMDSPASKRKYSEQPPTKHNTHN